MSQEQIAETQAEVQTESQESTQEQVTDTVATSAEPAKEPDTLLPDVKSEAATEDKPVASWGEDWREKYADGDEAKLNVLKRYNDPQSALDALFDARTKISKGTAKGIDEKSTPEEIDAWREVNGIPKTAEDYNLELGEGYVIGDGDRPLIESFLKSAHEKNMTNEQTSTTLKAYYDIVAQQESEEMEAALELKEESQNLIKEEWGAETDMKLKHLGNFLDSKFGENYAKLGTAVTLDGIALGNTPWFLKTMSDLASILEPNTKSIATEDTNTNNSAVESEYDELVKRQRTDPSYSTDKKAQARFVQLVEMRMKRGA